MSSVLEKAFWQFHNDNPEVYQLLVRFAREWHRVHEHCSISLLFERVRWEYSLTIWTRDGLKLNNNHRAYYARLLEEENPDLRGVFRLRQQRIQCTFGPANATLPPGGHRAP